MIVHCAVIGNPIFHSLSPLIHRLFAQQCNISLEYTKILGEEATFADTVVRFFNTQGTGLNCTLPFKKKAYALAQRRSERSVKAESANTLWQVAGVLHADNTDGIGLIRDLVRYKNLNQSRILILGAGGAAQGIIHPLLEYKPLHLCVANRSEEPLVALKKRVPSLSCIRLSEVNELFDIVINATSAGIKGEQCNLPKDLFRNKPFCYDLSYNIKEPTPFVAQARQQGCATTDGLGMLIEQAAEAFFIWHGITPNTDIVLEKLISK